MRKLVTVLALSGMCAWGQTLDLSSLDKLANRAKEAHKVQLDRDQLKMALKMMPDDEKKDPDTKKVLGGLGSVQVRNYEFEKSGEYSDADLDPIRAQIAKIPNCIMIVDSKEKNERSQISVCSDEGKGAALVILSAEPKELSVVFIRGSVSLSDLGKLNGVMGIPDFGSSKDKSDK